jgi:hypothetical protein
MNDPTTPSPGAGEAQEAPVAMREVTLTLCTAQVRDVVQQATAPDALGHAFAAALENPERLRSSLRPLVEDNTYSRSVLRALIILAGFPADGSERELTSVAVETGFSPGTTHRYLQTWTAAGLLARDADSRRYHRPPLQAAVVTAN